MAEEPKDNLSSDDMSDDQRKLIDMLGDDGDDDPASAAPATPPAKEEPVKADEPAPVETKADATATAPAEQHEKQPPEDAMDKRIEGLSKALAQNQQDIKTLLRKQEEKGDLTAKEQQRFDAAKERVATIEDDLADIRAIADRKENDGDVYAENPKLAKSHLKMAQRLKKSEEQIAALTTKLEAKASEQSATNYWDEQAKAHPGVDVQKEWTSSLTDAEARPALKKAAAMVQGNRLTQSEYDDMLREEASSLYHDRLKAAAKPAPAPKVEPVPVATPKPNQTAHRAPPHTPNGARVASDSGGPSPGTSMTSEERELHIIEKYLAD